MADYQAEIDRGMMGLRAEVDGRVRALAEEVGMAALDYAVRDTPVRSSDLIEGWELIHNHPQDTPGFILRNTVSYAASVKNPEYQAMLDQMPEWIAEQTR